MRAPSLLTLAFAGFVFAGGCDDKKDAADGGKAAAGKADGGKADAGGDKADGGKAVDGKDPAVAGLPSAEELLARAVEAQGGAAKVEAIQSLHLEGTVSVSGQNIQGDMKLWWKNGDFYSEQTMVGIGTVRAGKSGDVTWSDDPISGLRQLTGVEAEQNAWASSPSLPAQWKRYFETAKTVGERDLDGKKIYDVELVAKSGTKVTLSFDAASGLQVAHAFSQASPLGDTPVQVKLEDYREVDGFKLPYQQVMDISIAKATQTLSVVEFNVPVDTTKFAMPTGGAETAKAGAGPANDGEAPTTANPVTP